MLCFGFIVKVIMYQPVNGLIQIRAAFVPERQWDPSATFSTRQLCELSTAADWKSAIQQAKEICATGGARARRLTTRGSRYFGSEPGCDDPEDPRIVSPGVGHISGRLSETWDL